MQILHKDVTADHIKKCICTIDKDARILSIDVVFSEKVYRQKVRQLEIIYQLDGKTYKTKISYHLNGKY